MKKKKNSSSSTFSDALEAMNEATGNGMSENLLLYFVVLLYCCCLLFPIIIAIDALRLGYDC